MPIQECKYRFDNIKIQISFHYYYYFCIIDCVINFFFFLLDFASTDVEVIKFEQEYHNSNQLFFL